VGTPQVYSSQSVD